MPARRDDASQSTISSFFRPSQSPEKGKKRRRPSSPIEISSDDDQPSKKSKGSNPSNAGYDPSTNLADQWRFTPSQRTDSVPDTPQVTEEELRARKLRHEAFKKRLLMDNNRFINKISEPLEAYTDKDERGSISSEDEEEPSSVQKISNIFRSGTDTIQKQGKKSKARADIGPSGQSYTPLEQQVRKLKAENPGTVLMVEVGYKYKFFGEDAKIAAKELGMVAFNDRNFLVASIPTHRRDVHLKKLLAQGYRVGIVAQLETAALKKASSNRNAPFERNVTEVYTAATFVDGLDSVDDTERYIPPPFMCIVEDSKSKNGADVAIGLISISPSTSEVIWDDFSDTLMRIELETRLSHIRPTEILLSQSALSDATSKMLAHMAEDSSLGGRKLRTEYFTKELSYSEATRVVTEFYTDSTKYHSTSERTLLADAIDFPKRVMVALAQMIRYLTAQRALGILNAFIEKEFFIKFSTKIHMVLTANTLNNLEVYNNQTDYTVHGSLLWILDKTKTKFGARLLRSWIGRPLVDRQALEKRVEAIQEIVESSSDRLACLGQLLKGLPDLAKGLSRLLCGKCSPPELCLMLRAFQRIATSLDDIPEDSASKLRSNILESIVSKLPKLRPAIDSILSEIKIKEAEEGKKDEMWTNAEKYPKIYDAKFSILHVEADIDHKLKGIRKQLGLHSLEWTEVAGEEYLIQVRKSDNRPIPPNWILHSSTKVYERHQPPEVRQLVEERARYKETLQEEANAGYKAFLEDIISQHYTLLRDIVNKLATADCLFSFAHVALQENYVRPEFVDDEVLEIVEGRHPMIEVLRSDPFVPNTIIMGQDPKCKIITGPNMGGKSSCVRMIALIALMAQVGSYVPATSVKMGLLDSILTRMGASDDLAKGRSTFMVEMSETSEILHAATKNTLVILDELGRGTSTFDGMAIADAVLQHLAQNIKCKTLFITHYPLVASSLQAKFPADIENLHMGYKSDMRIDGTRSIVFLYQLAAGMAKESFGIECGRLAGLPEPLLAVAAEQSANMQASVEGRIKRLRIRKAMQIINLYLLDPSSSLNTFGELSTLVKSMMYK